MYCSYSLFRFWLFVPTLMWVTHLNNRFLISGGYSEPLNLVLHVSGQSLQKVGTLKEPFGTTQWGTQIPWRTGLDWELWLAQDEQELLHAPWRAWQKACPSPCLYQGTAFSCSWDLLKREGSQKTSLGLRELMAWGGPYFFKAGSTGAGNLHTSLRFRPCFPALSVM